MKLQPAEKPTTPFAMNPMIKEVVLVAGAGSCGGLLGTLASHVLKQSFPSGLLTSFLAAPVLGAGAALIGVYLLANSDRKEMARCMVFAMACGIVWKPVLDAGGAMVTQRANVVSAEQKADQVRDVSSDLATLSGTAGAEDKMKIETKLEEASELAASSLTSARAADSLELKEKAKSSFSELMKSGAVLRSKNLLTPGGEQYLKKIEARAATIND
jgi:hypothetical protein